MTQIPGLNPVDTAPPVPPGDGYPQIVTTDTVKRLLAKIAELERRIAMLERR